MQEMADKRLPRPPDGGKPSTRTSSKPTRRDLTFESYNLSHPVLLEEVTNMVNLGLKAIEKDSPVQKERQ